MNQEQEYQVSQAKGRVNQIRHTLEELEQLGWKATETVKPLASFDAYRGRMAANQAAIDACSPLDKGGKDKLATLLSEENLIVQSLEKLANEASQALTDEQLALYDARGGLFSTLGQEMGEADNQIEQAIGWLIEALQLKWILMLKSHELAAKMEQISVEHNTPESFGAGSIQLPKPFPKLGQNNWGAFVASFMSRVTTVFSNCETTTPSDTVKTIFEK